MNVAITGSAGFIGSHVADWFTNNGFGVVAIDSFTYAANPANTIDFEPNAIAGYKIDINQQQDISSICKNHDIQWIINLAAHTHVDRSIESCDDFLWSNVLGVKSLLEVCKEDSVKLLHVSTDEVYGDIAEGSFHEHTRLNPKNPYAATKASADMMIKAYENTYGVECIIVRPSNNFGPRQHTEKLFPKSVTRISEGKKVPLYGDGNQIREWTSVYETASAIGFIIKNRESLRNNIYNISSGIELQNIEMIKLICDVMNKEADEHIEFVEDRLGHDQRYSISSQFLRGEGFEYEGDFHSDIEKTVKHYARST